LDWGFFGVNVLILFRFSSPLSEVSHLYSATFLICPINRATTISYRNIQKSETLFLHFSCTFKVLYFAKKKAICLETEDLGIGQIAEYKDRR